MAWAVVIDGPGLLAMPGKELVQPQVVYPFGDRRRDAIKDGSFSFPGFTHICGTSRKTGYYTVHRKTIGKPMAAKLKDILAKLRQRMHEKIRGTLGWLQSVVRGYFRYHAVPGNEKRLKAFLTK